jgi:hypothetical protein
MTMVVSYGKLAPETSLLDQNANELAHAQDMLLDGHARLLGR